jgi:rootletin
MDSPVGSVGSDLRRQNDELRARLAGEAADHKRRLDAYRRAQQGQAALVSRLQAKVRIVVKRSVTLHVKECYS